MASPRDASVAAPPSLRRLIGFVGAAMFVDAILFGALAPLLPTYRDDFGLTTAEAGVLSGAIGAGLLLAALPTAALANRIGGKRAVVAGLGLLALASAVFAVAEQVELMVVARFFQGVAGAMIWAGGLTWIAGAALPERRGAAIGTLVGIGIAGTVAGPLAGSLAVATSPDLVFGALPLIAVGLIALLLPLPDSRQARQGGGLQLLRGQPVARRAAGLNLWFLLLPSTAMGLISVLGPLRLDEAGAAAGLIGLVFLCAGGSEAGVNAVGGRLTDRVGTVPILRVGMIAIGVVIAIFGLVAGIGPIAIAIVAFSTAMGLFGAPINVSLYAVLGDAGVGEAHAFGIYNLGFSGGFLIGASGGGSLSDLAGDLAPCLLISAAALLSAQLVRMTVVSPAGRTDTAIPELAGPVTGDRARR